MAKDPNPVIIYSDHSGRFEHHGHRVEVSIFRLEGESEWSLEVIDQSGNSTVWNQPFASDEAAWTTFLIVIEKEGIEPFIESVESTKLNLITQ
jgi:hypothetical protein